MRGEILVRRIDDQYAMGAQPMASFSVDCVGASAILSFQQFQGDTRTRRRQQRSSDRSAAIRGCDYISTLFQQA